MSEENKQKYTLLTDKQKEEVREILLMPIIIDQDLQKQIGVRFFRKGTVLFSMQDYTAPGSKKRTLDPDMSDIAVAFYEIIYRNTIMFSKENLGESFPGYAGDTMNSFNSVAKNASPEMKQKWYFRYHCLANFWLYNYGTQGRRESKYPGNVSCNDSLDAYLSFNNVDLNQHYLSRYKPLWSGTKDKIKDHINQYECQANSVINKMIECIELRADNIVRDEKVCNELYKFFKENNLL